jgi:hypothetical protein
MLLDEEFDHAGAALHRSLPRSPTDDLGFWHRVERGSSHASPGRRLASSFLGAATAVPLSATDLATRYGLLPKRGADFFTETARYIVFDTVLCYMYGPEDTQVGEFGDGTTLERHSTSRMCFPAIPFAPQRLGSFKQAVGLPESFDFSSIEYEEACSSPNVKAVVDTVGIPEAWNAGPLAVVYRAAEAVDSIQNLAAAGNGSMSSADKGASLICGVAQIGGLLFTSLAVTALLVICSCAPLGGAACVVCLRVFRRRRARKAERDAAMDALLETAKANGWT